MTFHSLRLRCSVFINVGIVISYYCSTVHTCSTWTSVDPDAYSQTYISKTNPNANTSRPLGYMVGNAVFGQTKQSCVVVENTEGNGRHIEVNLEIGDGTIRISNGVSESFPDTGTLCKTTTGNSMVFYFDCEACEGSQVTFWFRVVVEELKSGATEYDENWCQSRDADFPRSLKPVVIPEKIPTPADNNPSGGAAEMKVGKICIMIMILLSILIGNNI